MTRVVLRSGLAAAVLSAAVAPAFAQGQFGSPSTSSRQAEDRRTDETARQTQPARQTEAPKPQDAHKAAESPARNDAKPTVARQPEPQRQHEPARQQEPARRGDSDHWGDPGPAWRSNGPAWRDLNDRPGVQRPGEDAFRATPNTFAPRDRDRRDGNSRRGGRNREVYIVPYGIPVPYYVEGSPYPSTELAVQPPPPAEPRADERPLGFLQLRVTPRTADVVVDGVLAGTVDDFGGRGARMLPAGPHRVEITAPGFDPLTIDVRVPENDTVTFTRDLDPATTVRPAPEPVSIPHKTMYIVPMCFIGDRPPLPSDMPAGCRVEDVRVIP